MKITKTVLNHYEMPGDGKHLKALEEDYFQSLIVFQIIFQNNIGGILSNSIILATEENKAGSTLLID